ncbi:MAG: 3'(2'),5'-bisphosphate nucleotidase CysQ family protein [Hyphomicrobiaceae bacterium]
MKIPSHQELVRALLPAVGAAARLEMSYFRGDFAIERKADSSPVTVADQEAELIILKALTAAAPDVPIIAEEQYSAGIVPDVDGTLFLVDALDGTRAFVKGNTDFTINVALVVDRAPVFGLILLPANGQLYVTTGPNAAGFAKIDVQSEFDANEVMFEPVRTRKPDPNALVVTLSNSHPSKRLDQALADKPIGSRLEAGSSLKFCRMAEGKADFYPRFGSISEWDIAAGHAILKAAGGEVTDFEGEPLRYGNDAAKYRTPPFVAWGKEELKSQIRFSAD